MSEAQFKPIKINPELFTISPRNIKNKTLKKSKSQDNSQPKKLKQELLAKIKNYRSNNKSEIVDTLPRNTYSVNKSDNIKLNPNLVMNPSLLKPVNKESDHIQNTTLTTKKTEVDPDDDFMQSINFLKELSSKNKKKQSNSQDDFPLTLSKDDTFIHDAKISPPYSCLKNSTLPTYREWKNKTLKNSTDISCNVEITDVNEYISGNLASIPHHQKKTLKYYLGKRGRKVAILVKNSETRKNITREHNLLKQTKLGDMKNYLKRHNLLKSGSHAPPDVIKKLYEQALLGGDIRNSNKNAIIHNYLAE